MKSGYLFAMMLVAASAVTAALPPELAAIERRAAEIGAMKPAEREDMRRRALQALADVELEPPTLMTGKIPERYRKAKLNYSMNGGCAVTPGGRIWSVWMCGEDGLKAFVVGCWSDDGGRTWSDTKLVVDSHFRGNRLGYVNLVRNNLIANVWVLDDGKLRFTVFQSLNNWIGRGGTWEFVCENPDAAEPKWSQGRYICAGSIHNKPTRLRDGTWIFPNDWEPFGDTFPELRKFMGCGALALLPNGAWERRGFVIPADSPRHYAEHNIVENPDGGLRMVLRTSLGLMDCTSPDGGLTWTKPVPTTTFRQVIARFVFRRLKSGRLLLVKNSDDLLYPPLDWKPSGAPRDKMCAWLSEDEGKTWKGPLVLDDRKAVSYPDAFEFPDGGIGITYDHDRGGNAGIVFARFCEADVLARKIVNPKSFLRSVVVSRGAKPASKR